MDKVFVTGIGTNVGKTVVSSILVEAHKADYWKPIQAGELNNSDTKKVKSYISNNKSVFHQESFKFQNSLSPHEASAIEGINVGLEDLIIPSSTNNLIIEGAGGLMVPFNNQGDTFLDFVRINDLPVVVVVSFYLGSINHTLLTLEVLRQNEINVLGLVFNGTQNIASRNIILSKSGIIPLVEIPKIDEVNKASILKVTSSLERCISGW